MSLRDLKTNIAGLTGAERFLDAWIGWRGGDLVPHRASVAPEDLKSTMRSVSILELPGDDTIGVRLLATALQEKISDHAKIKDLLLLTNEADRQERKSRYQKVVSNPCAMLAENELYLKSGFRFDIYTFALPVKCAVPDCTLVYRLTEFVSRVPEYEFKPSEFFEIPLSKNVRFFELY